MKIKKIPLRFLIAVLIGIAVIIILIRLLTSTSDQSKEAEKNVSRLEEMENSDISSIESQINDQSSDDTAPEVSTEAFTGYDNLKVLSTSELQKVYKGVVILGDSITNSIVEYEYLGRDVVISEIGLSVAKADEQIETAIGLNPSKIIMCFGANDLETYVDKSDLFISAYTTQIEKLQKALPNCQIYINSIFPIQDFLIEEKPALGYYDEYNTALQTMCSELNCIYIDSTVLLEGNDDLYEPDGEHPVMDFYPKWLTYMAKQAGL